MSIAKPTTMASHKNNFVVLLALVCLVMATSFMMSPPSFIQSRAIVSISQSNQLSMGFFDDIVKRFTQKAEASHILIKGGAEAEIKLLDLKTEIGDSPEKFAELAGVYSSCPSGKKGGALGKFGPGQMVKEFDTVVFNDDVGVVHGPIKTQFGYHLILVTDRTE